MAEYSTAGIVFKIGSNTIPACFSTPDLGSEPARIDVTSFDDTTNKRYIPGLQDVQTLNFDFFSKDGNFSTAKNAEPANGATTNYTLIFPDGTTYTWTGSHRTFQIAATVGDPLKFRVACTLGGEITITAGSVGGST